MTAPTLPLWIRTPADLEALTVSLRGVSAVAVDTEADSLHHYPGKLCLVQIASEDGRAHLVDPLVLPDLRSLAPLFGDASVVKVLHAADNDLAYLKRLHGFTVTSLFDTAIAARCLGHTTLGLDGLLRDYLGVEAGASRQKDDWSHRPLSHAQETYALNDVLHLIALRARLTAELQARGRLHWLEEECAALAALSVAEKPPDPDAFLWLKGAKDLDRRGLAVLRELYQLREQLALEADRPPFMILGHDAVVRLATRRPHDATEMLEVPGCTQKVVRRVGARVIEAVRRAEALPMEALPGRSRTSRPGVPAAVRRRSEALRAWRREVARRVGLDPGFLLPQRLIDRLAAEPPRDLDDLARVEGMRRWRTEVVGREILATLARQ